MLASEIFSAKVDVVPQPAEYNVHLVSSDPRMGRYKKAQQSSHLCKTIRKNIINNILKKYHLVEPKVDSGKKRKKTSKKDLDEWKLRRAQGLEGWKKKKRVISTKKKKFQKYQVVPRFQSSVRLDTQYLHLTTIFLTFQAMFNMWRLPFQKDLFKQRFESQFDSATNQSKSRSHQGKHGRSLVKIECSRTNL